MTYIITAFNQDFPLTEDEITQSKLFMTNLSSTHPRLTLDVEPRLLPSFMTIYNYLRHPEEEIKITSDNIDDLIELANLLGMTRLEDYLGNIVILNAFNRDYLIPRDSIKESKFLTSALSGRFKEGSHYISLGLDPVYEIPFELIVDYLRTGHIPDDELDDDDIVNLIILADYLIMDKLINKIIPLLQYLDYDRGALVMIELAYIPQIARLGKLYFSTKSRYYLEDYSPRMKKLVNRLAGQITNLPIIMKINGRSRSDLTEIKTIMPRGWASSCKGIEQPRVIGAPQICDVIAMAKPLSYYNGHYLTCSRGELSPAHCCKPIQGESSNKINPNLVKGKEALVSDNNWVIIVDEGYHGDFVIIWRPLIRADLRIIIETL